MCHHNINSGKQISLLGNYLQGGVSTHLYRRWFFLILNLDSRKVIYTDNSSRTINITHMSEASVLFSISYLSIYLIYHCPELLKQDCQALVFKLN